MTVNPRQSLNFTLLVPKSLVILLYLALSSAGLFSSPQTESFWRSAALAREIECVVREPQRTTSDDVARPLIVYLRGLAAPRVGTEGDKEIVADFLREGYLVAELNYAGDPRARWPRLNQDLAALRRALHEKTWLSHQRIDAAHIYLVPSGHRLLRDVEFYSTSERRLALDLIYPSRPVRPVGVVLEFSCDNQDRMGNFSLQFCTDTLLEGAATEGLAVAMADHPVAAPYRGLDPMPESAWKVTAAVRAVRTVAVAKGGNGRVATLGFSRGSGMALLAVTAAGKREWQVGGAHPEVSSEVQGAVVLSGRFTYLDLLANDPMIPRYTAAWGERTVQTETWRRHGVLDALAAPTLPLFLSINRTESPEALHQMEVLRRRLTELGSPYIYSPETTPRGHRMPLQEDVLTHLLSYLRSVLAQSAPGGAAFTPSP